MTTIPAIVITHPDKGIFIGEAMGMAFFSKEDPVGQDAAVAFTDTADAKAYTETWNPPMDGLIFQPVEADIFRDSRMFASVDACARAGLEKWDPNLDGDAYLADPGIQP